MEARRLVEEALGAARTAADDAAAREARRMVEEGIREQGERLAAEEAESASSGAGRCRSVARQATGCGCQAAATGEVLELRPDGKP